MVYPTAKVGDNIYDRDGYLGRIREINKGVARVFWPENCAIDHVPVELIDGKDYVIAMMADPPLRKPSKWRLLFARFLNSVK